MTIHSGSATDAGRLRSTNQDRWVGAGGVYAVADGMGGHAAGEVASSLAADCLRRLNDCAQLRPDDVRAALDEANRKILTSAERHPERTGMGTTAAGLCQVRVAGSTHWLVFNIGDSRVYRFASGMLTRLTVDHSAVAELVSAGRLSEADSRDHPESHVVTRALGAAPEPEIDFWVFPPVPGDRFLICSDGLTVEVEDDLIAEVLRDEPMAQAAADSLVRKALQAGGRDNVTVVVVDQGPAQDGAAGDTVPRARPAGGGG